MAKCTLCQRVVAPNVAKSIHPEKKDIILCKQCFDGIQIIKEGDMDFNSRYNFYIKRKEMVEQVANEEHKKILLKYLNDSELLKDIIEIDEGDADSESIISGLTILDEEEFNTIKQIVLDHEEEPIITLRGNRGHNLSLYNNRCEFRVDVTIGSVLTNNATDGTKTVFFKDVIGVQFKESRAAIGYLQLETAASLGNNKNSNFFAENTFTFDANMNEVMNMLYKYVVIKVGEFK